MYKKGFSIFLYFVLVNGIMSKELDILFYFSTACLDDSQTHQLFQFYNPSVTCLSNCVKNCWKTVHSAPT